MATDGGLPATWQPAYPCELGRLPGCQTAKCPPERARARARARAGSPESGSLAVWAGQRRFYVAACLAFCRQLAACHRPTVRAAPVNRDEYLAVLESEPATRNQCGAIMREFERFGFHHRRNRAERLAACASLLGIDELSSTTDLTQGQAGQLVRALEHITDRAALWQAAGLRTDDDEQPAGHDDQGADEAGEASPAASARETWPEALTRLMVMSYQATSARTESGLRGSAESPENRT